MKCKDCKFWDPIEVKKRGLCRVEPPSFQVSGGKWPHTLPEDWCGAYLPRDYEEDDSDPIIYLHTDTLVVKAGGHNIRFDKSDDVDEVEDWDG